jgi:hypothetical protein
MELHAKPEMLTTYTVYMDLPLAMLKAVSFYLLHNIQHRINAESYPVAQLCVNTLPATKITLITDGI